MVEKKFGVAPRLATQARLNAVGAKNVVSRMMLKNPLGFPCLKYSKAWGLKLTGNPGTKTQRVGKLVVNNKTCRTEWPQIDTRCQHSRRGWQTVRS